MSKKKQADVEVSFSGSDFAKIADIAEKMHGDDPQAASKVADLQSLQAEWDKIAVILADKKADIRDHKKIMADTADAIAAHIRDLGKPPEKTLFDESEVAE